MRAAVLTAIYDGYDVLRPTCPQDGLDVEWICVTDNPHQDPLGWQIVHDPYPALHPNRAAKMPKLLPWRYSDAPASVWVDASYRVVSPTFVADTLALAEPIAQFVHPWRDCIYDEAVASALPKYVGEPITAQVDHYCWTYHHPEHWGLWATGVIARHHTNPVMAFGMRWLEEIERWSFQDQLSEPIALRASDLRPVALPGTHLENAWLSHEESTRH